MTFDPSRAPETARFDPQHVLATLAARHGITFDPTLLPCSQRLERSDGPGLHYLAWGGRGPRVVLLHGGALTAHTWDLVCLALGGAYRCAALDLRGHGDSDWSDSYRIEDSVADLRALIAQLGDEPVHLVGMSLGGNVAGHTAQGLAARLRSLTFVDIAPGVNRDGTTVMRSFLTSAGAYPSVDALVAAAQAVSPRTDLDLLRYRYHYMTRQTADGWAFRNDRRRKFDFEHVTRKLAELSEVAAEVGCPTLVAVGARSRVLGEPAARAFAQRFARGSCVVIPDAGHNVQEDAPRALADALRAHFVASDG